ncbi:PREDICTED: oxysterol-binding protein-related protein 7 [Gekko japonicus]|uniref:Oxysterol-binding protein n=1 Tax=Gekko japonicus TaxID=146911 RepID=A0ABM1K2I0_GEKJA|nr:PREDICTED: oxysterol-binding protein-related protein 7 [Gekko japonicus]
MGSHEKDPSSPKRPLPPSRSNSTVSSKHSITQQGSESWEVVDEMRIQSSVVQEPERQEGYLLKKRKWPLKGWHKRYFVLEDGILKYATTRQDVICVPVPNAAASSASNPLQIKSQELFNNWVAKLCSHRQVEKMGASQRQFLTRGHGGKGPYSAQASGSRHRVQMSESAPALSSLACPRDKVNSWLSSSKSLDRCSAELSECQGKLQELNQMLQNLESLHRIPSAPIISHSQSSTGTERTRKGKRSTRIWCTQSFAKDDTIGRVGRLHGSVPNLSRYLESCPNQALFSLPPEYSQLQRSFWILAQKVHGSLSSVLAMLAAERDRLQELQRTLEQQHSTAASAQGGRGSGIGIAAVGPNSVLVKGQEQHQLSNRSIVSLSDSHTEFFDACEVFLSASSSENEATDDESCLSEVTNSLFEEATNMAGMPARCPKGLSTIRCFEDPSEGSLGLPASLPLYLPGPGSGISRRNCLPVSHVHTSDVSLWNILRNNIGKDLSKVSMPVQLNEPLNTLQRLCEELEYSSLLDAAGCSPDPCERLLCMAAFAVSAYASTYFRAGSKPFNPVLGETYECVRPDKGFCFISEQVCHHPPISACHAESDNFVFWQDMKWKNKFWGKSLEIIPVGTVNVRLPRFGDHYEWNKVTSCIHNILSGQRWIEHYGEVLIRNTRDSTYHCKITFCKARYWGSGVNEVQGAILSHTGKVVHRLFGKWHDGLYCGVAPLGKCIWRPNPMPRDYEKNYGFTQFALELNELTPELKHLLPSTDTRLRPDQRYLEEGNVQAAESQKRRIEQLQRDRRRVMEDNNILHQARFFRRQVDTNSKESWVSNGTYWKLRAEPGFSNMDSAVLW